MAVELIQLKLREYLLYWDRIDFPQNNIIGFGDSPEIAFLKSCNVLKQTRITFTGSGEMTAAYLSCQLQAVRMNNEIKGEKGCWSLAQEGSKLFFNQNEAIKKSNIQMNLHECLPVPNKDVSLDDILNFKERRSDEFLAFHGMMDELYLEVGDSSDPLRAELKNIEKLQRSITELHQIMDESKMKRLLGSVKIEVDVKGMIENTIGYAMAGKTLGFSAIGSGALGLASSFIKVDSELSLKPKAIPDELRDYAYLYYAEKEFQ